MNIVQASWTENIQRNCVSINTNTLCENVCLWDCKKAFTHNSSFNFHVWIHSGDKPYLCVKCQETFYFNNDLTQHLKGHEDILHICKICQIIFLTDESLTGHLRIHNTQKLLYVCEKCEVAFSTKHK